MPPVSQALGWRDRAAGGRFYLGEANVYQNHKTTSESCQPGLNDRKLRT